MRWSEDLPEHVVPYCDEHSYTIFWVRVWFRKKFFIGCQNCPYRYTLGYRNMAKR